MYDDTPLYVDIVLIATYVLLAATILATAWSAWHGIKTHSRMQTALELRHADKLTYCAIATPIVCLLLTFALSSTEPLTINGRLYADTFWLRTTDMFILTSIILIAICFAIVVIGKFRR